ncbi:MAG: phosphate/phosphite/phosphonate ABC transporter substrate-binding protein, partial [Candidatus Edwardsbacteria bacterium]|nr:phosphate/phosphite/phosphonate ABC transporter substrate-binding protein [Candidatus Edwardsbacteria bacterium]
MTSLRIHRAPLLAAVLLVIAGCGEPGRGRYSQASLKMAFQPAHSGAVMNRAFAPLLEHLSSETGYEIQYVSSLAHDGFGAAVGGAGAAVAFCDPLTYLTLQRTQAARALAAGVGPEGDRSAAGVIAVAERSPLSGLPQLKGAVIAFVSRRSSEGYLSQALACAAAGVALPGDAR